MQLIQINGGILVLDSINPALPKRKKRLPVAKLAPSRRSLRQQERVIPNMADTNTDGDSESYNSEDTAYEYSETESDAQRGRDQKYYTDPTTGITSMCKYT